MSPPMRPFILLSSLVLVVFSQQASNGQPNPPPPAVASKYKFITIRVPVFQMAYVPKPDVLMAAAAEASEKEIFAPDDYNKMSTLGYGRIQDESQIEDELKAAGVIQGRKKRSGQWMRMDGEWTVERVDGPGEDDEIHVVVE